MKTEDIFTQLATDGIESWPVAFRDQVEAIRAFVEREGFQRTLEVGFGVGGSASHIMAVSQGRHVAMDPFQSVVYAGQGLKNLAKLGLAERLEFYEGYSYDVLPALARQGRRFDFIYIDGDHKFDFTLMDFHYADLLLDEGGCVLLDDRWMSSVRKVEDYVDRSFGGRYAKLPDIYSNGALYRKRRAGAGPVVPGYRVF